MARANHVHDPRWVMGQYPIAAECRTCSMKLIANGVGWVALADARKAQARVGIRGAL